MSITLSADPSGTFGTIKINGIDQLKIYNDGTLKSASGKVIGTNEGILGTTSQEGGIPTGSIIERGSNANGEYVMFADGTLICTAINTISTGTLSWQSFGLPAVFTAAPCCSLSFGTTSISGTDTNWWDRIQQFSIASSVGTSYAILFRSGAYTAVTGSGLGFVTAKGRWF